MNNEWEKEFDDFVQDYVLESWSHSQYTNQKEEIKTFIATLLKREREKRFTKEEGNHYVQKSFEEGYRCGHNEGHKDGVNYRNSQIRMFIDKQTQDKGMDEAWYGAFFSMKRFLEALTPTTTDKTTEV